MGQMLGLHLLLKENTQVKFSAHDMLKYFFLFFPENRILHFMQIVSLYNLSSVNNISVILILI